MYSSKVRNILMFYLCVFDWAVDIAGECMVLASFAYDVDWDNVLLFSVLDQTRFVVQCNVFVHFL